MSEPGSAAVVDDEALRGFIPPSWKAGSSWIIEQWTWHYHGLARFRPPLQERYAEVYFRVEGVDENEAVLSALATQPAGAEDAATIRIRLRPFHAVSFEDGRGHTFSRLGLNDPATDYHEDFLIASRPRPAVTWRAASSMRTGRSLTARRGTSGLIHTSATSGGTS